MLKIEGDYFLAKIYSIKELYFIRDLTQKLKDSRAGVKWDAAHELALYYLNKKDENGFRKLLSHKDPYVIVPTVAILRSAILNGEDITFALRALKKVYPDLMLEKVSNIPQNKQKDIIDNFLVKLGMKIRIDKKEIIKEAIRRVIEKRRERIKKIEKIKEIEKYKPKKPQPPQPTKPKPK